MWENLKVKKYERKITPLERIFSRSPWAIVAVIARIKGSISKGMLINAVAKVQQRHANLRVRIQVDEEHVPWFTSAGVKEIPVEIVPRDSDNHWIKVYEDNCPIPFEFEERPAIRFILVQSPLKSELIILCHHIICDGLSLAYLARDLMVHLGDPNREVEVLPNPVPMNRDNIPREVSLNPITRFFINRINKKWEKDKIYFDQEDYKNFNQTYWANSKHRMLSIELSEAQTSALIERCRKEEITVNTALTAAFVGAQCTVQGHKPYHSIIGIAVSMRNRLKIPVGEVMGFYAGLVNLKCKYNSKISFWENARRFHRKIKPLFTNKNLFKEALILSYLEPTILESFNLKKLGRLIPSNYTRYHKLFDFSKRKDVVLSILKRKKADSLDGVFMGTAITNLTRMDFPKKYGTLELDRLIMNPGSASPLANVNLILGVVTCAEKLSLVIEYAEETVDTITMEKIKDQAMKNLALLNSDMNLSHAEAQRRRE